MKPNPSQMRIFITCLFPFHVCELKSSLTKGSKATKGFKRFKATQGLDNNHDWLIAIPPSLVRPSDCLRTLFVRILRFS